MKDDDPERLERALRKYPPEEREAWILEITRLAAVAEAYLEIKPKKSRAKSGGRFEFAPEVLMLCRQAGSTDTVIIRREPHRRNLPSPYTLDRWARAYRKEGMSVFVREESGAEMDESEFASGAGTIEPTANQPSLQASMGNCKISASKFPSEPCRG